MCHRKEIQNITKKAIKRYHALSRLVKSLNKKDCVVAEIGVFDSLTTKRILRSCGDVISQYWAVDFWQSNGHSAYMDITAERWDELYAYSCKLMYWFTQLHVLRMSSIEASKIFPRGYFDLVFIDADHYYESIKADIGAWLPLVKKGGFLTGHDYNRSHLGVVRATEECLGKIVRVPDNVWVKKI